MPGPDGRGNIGSVQGVRSAEGFGQAGSPGPYDQAENEAGEGVDQGGIGVGGGEIRGR